MLGCYIHIPFCEKICDYCDFSTIQAPIRLHDEFLILLEHEIECFFEQNPGILSRVETLYIGGGTPSILSPKHLTHLFEILKKYQIPLMHLKEFTVEFNPESLDEEKLFVCKKYGVNRISLGLQSFSPEILARIGRKHSKDLGIRALEHMIQLREFKINCDLMFNLPGQTPEEFLCDLDFLSDFEIDHISFYGLKVDEKTRLGIRIKKQLEFVDEDLYPEMYLRGVALLERKKFSRYETSNFAKTNCESLHNLNYWKRGEYLGFGPSAHSFFKGVRFYAPEKYPAWRKYIQSHCSKEMITFDTINKEERIAEIIQLSLRMREGICLDELEKEGVFIPEKNIEYWEKLDYLKREKNRIFLKGKGWLFMDAVVEDFYLNYKKLN